MNLPPTARSWAEIDLGALRHNARVAQERVGPDVALLAVVKANGYGHGLLPVARELALGAGVRRFGVANVAEAACLQDDGAWPPEVARDVTISLLSPALPDERAQVIRRRLVPWLSTVEEARAYAAEVTLTQTAEPLTVEIEIDTGMGRSGVLPPDFPALRRAVTELPELRLRGLVTHLPSPDDDTAFTREQLSAFAKLIPTAAEDADARTNVHAQNSAGLLDYPLTAGCNSVRPGLMLYGASPLAECQALLRPVLTLKTRVTLVRELPAGWGVSYGRTFVTPAPMRVATLAAGYGDGYPRHLSGTGVAVLLRGRRCPLLGRVTMDQLVVDISALEPPAVTPGEEVVLLGRQGNEEISAGELAARSGTIAWEIFTGLTSRVVRRYFNRSG